MKLVPWIIIILLLLVILFLRECQPPAPELDCSDCPKRIVEIPGDPYPVKGDTVFIVDTVDRIKDTTIYKEVPADVDTAAILAMFYSEVYGQDTIINDSSLMLHLRWMVFKNQLQWIIPSVQNKRPAQIIYQLENPPVTKMFAGLGVGRNPNQFGIAPSLALLTKKDHLYDIKYDLVNKDFYFTLYWKISFKKKKK